MIEEATYKDADKIRLAYREGTHRIVVWKRKKKKVFFSMVRRGDSMEIHIASRNGKFYLERSVNEFCDWVFKCFDWCDSITGIVQNHRKSTLDLARRTGFKMIGNVTINNNEECTMIKRSRSWAD